MSTVSLNGCHIYIIDVGPTYRGLIDLVKSDTKDLHDDSGEKEKVIRDNSNTKFFTTQSEINLHTVVFGPSGDSKPLLSNSLNPFESTNGMRNYRGMRKHTI